MVYAYNPATQEVEIRRIKGLRPIQAKVNKTHHN
jgi:hypothetical protein